MTLVTPRGEAVGLLAMVGERFGFFIVEYVDMKEIMNTPSSSLTPDESKLPVKALKFLSCEAVKLSSLIT